ncbi:hypothetical protein HK098_005460 [Nowakowskiella sp. JEL0407]|nr:hypothetical protein HK098_005460 [Nowakowskiella sp. JEL0407]
MDSRVVLRNSITPHYSLVALGEGTYGSVFKVVKTDGEVFAVKVFKGQNAENTMFGFEVADETLQGFCHRMGSLSDDVVMEIMKQLLNGVNAIHRIGMVHRDLKTNKSSDFYILIMKNSGKLNICDFGLASASASKPAIAETLGYLSLEYEGYESFGPEIDLWACGIIMFYLYTGLLPFGSVMKAMNVLGRPGKEFTDHISRTSPSDCDLIDSLKVLSEAEREEAIVNHLESCRPGVSKIISPKALSLLVGLLSYKDERLTVVEAIDLLLSPSVDVSDADDTSDDQVCPDGDFVHGVGWDGDVDMMDADDSIDNQQTSTTSSSKEEFDILTRVEDRNGQLDKHDNAGVVNGNGDKLDSRTNWIKSPMAAEQNDSAGRREVVCNNGSAVQADGSINDGNQTGGCDRLLKSDKGAGFPTRDVGEQGSCVEHNLENNEKGTWSPNTTTYDKCNVEMYEFESVGNGAIRKFIPAVNGITPPPGLSKLVTVRLSQVEHEKIFNGVEHAERNTINEMEPMSSNPILAIDKSTRFADRDMKLLRTTEKHIKPDAKSSNTLVDLTKSQAIVVRKGKLCTGRAVRETFWLSGIGGGDVTFSNLSRGDMTMGHNVKVKNAIFVGLIGIGLLANRKYSPISFPPSLYSTSLETFVIDRKNNDTSPLRDIISLNTQDPILGAKEKSISIFKLVGLDKKVDYREIFTNLYRADESPLVGKMIAKIASKDNPRNLSSIDTHELEYMKEGQGTDKFGHSLSLENTTGGCEIVVIHSGEFRIRRNKMCQLLLKSCEITGSRTFEESEVQSAKIEEILDSASHVGNAPTIKFIPTRDRICPPPDLWEIVSRYQHRFERNVVRIDAGREDGDCANIPDLCKTILSVKHMKTVAAGLIDKNHTSHFAAAKNVEEFNEDSLIGIGKMSPIIGLKRQRDDTNEHHDRNNKGLILRSRAFYEFFLFYIRQSALRENQKVENLSGVSTDISLCSYDSDNVKWSERNNSTKIHINISIDHQNKSSLEILKARLALALQLGKNKHR